MIPILAGFIAYAIAGRAALAPAMVGAMVANTPAILGTKAGTGFLGAILVGYAAGYLTKWMNSWPIPKSLRGYADFCYPAIRDCGYLCSLCLSAWQSDFPG